MSHEVVLVNGWIANVEAVPTLKLTVEVVWVLTGVENSLHHDTRVILSCTRLLGALLSPVSIVISPIVEN